MLNFIVYESGTGIILRTGVCQDGELDAQAEESGELVMEGIANDMTQKVEEDSAGPYIIDKMPGEICAALPRTLILPTSWYCDEGFPFWENGANGYDEDGETYAAEITHSLDWIRFTFTAVAMSKIMMFIIADLDDSSGTEFDDADFLLEIHYNGDPEDTWYGIWDGPATKNEWFECDTDSGGLLIDSIRITNNIPDNYLRIYEIGAIGLERYYLPSYIRHGATQEAVDADVDEHWITDGHATLPDGVVMVGI